MITLCNQVVEEENKLFEQYSPLLKKFVPESIPSQIAFLDIVQRFCHSLQFPKGSEPPPPNI